MARRGAKRSVQRVQLEWYGDEFLAIVKEHGNEALFAAAQIVMAEATRRAPVGRTGNLKKSGYVAVPGKSTYVRRKYWRREKKVRTGEAVIAFTAPHAHLIESGRRKRGEILPRKRGRKALRINGRLLARSKFKRMSSKPFLGPALEASQETIPEELAKVYRTWLERLLGGRP